MQRRANSDPVKSLPVAKIRTVVKSIPRAKSLPLEKVRTVHQDKKGVCSRILTPKQVGPICWFMATFVAMFYSQRSRKILLEASKSWREDKLFDLLKHVLNDKYLKKASRESEDYRNFSDDTFINLLKYLNEHDPLSFPYKPETSRGFKVEYYIGKLYKLLGVDYIIYDFTSKDDKIYSYFKYLNSPKILLVIVRDNGTIPEEMNNNGLKSMRENIKYNGEGYTLDSVILVNWNKKKGKKNGHAIAGITCKKKKYIYNGWTRGNMNPDIDNDMNPIRIPCELMEYDWNIIKDDDFCLNKNDCIPEILGIELPRFCFNFSRGKRILVYVRKDDTNATSIDTMSYDENIGIIPYIEDEKHFEKELYNTIIDIGKIYQTQKEKSKNMLDK